jgi:beta-glucosidase
MNGLLKTELGFQGFVVSDWYGAHTGVAGNLAGLDMVMPSSQFLTPSSMASAVRNGSVPEARLDDQATRILAAWYRYAHLENPGMNGMFFAIETTACLRSETCSCLPD